MNYTEMLIEHVEKLKAVERKLAEFLAKETDSDRWLKAHELSLIAQNQVGLTANQLNASGHSAAKAEPQV
jgi:hypothetical protein